MVCPVIPLAFWPGEAGVPGTGFLLSGRVTCVSNISFGDVELNQTTSCLVRQRLRQKPSVSLRQNRFGDAPIPARRAFRGGDFRRWWAEGHRRWWTTGRVAWPSAPVDRLDHLRALFPEQAVTQPSRSPLRTASRDPRVKCASPPARGLAPSRAVSPRRRDPTSVSARQSPPSICRMGGHAGHARAPLFSTESRSNRSASPASSISPVDPPCLVAPDSRRERRAASS